jgi:hypothetical protein
VILLCSIPTSGSPNQAPSADEHDERGEQHKSHRVHGEFGGRVAINAVPLWQHHQIAKIRVSHYSTRLEPGRGELTGQRRISLRSIQRKLHPRIRTKPAPSLSSGRSSLVIDLQPIRGRRKRYVRPVLLVVKGRPDDLGRGSRDDVLDFSGSVGRADRVGVPVLRTRGDDGQGGWGDAAKDSGGLR